VARLALDQLVEVRILAGQPAFVALSSRGPGRVVLSHQTGVRIPVALPVPPNWPGLQPAASSPWYGRMPPAFLKACSAVRSRSEGIVRQGGTRRRLPRSLRALERNRGRHLLVFLPVDQLDSYSHRLAPGVVEPAGGVVVAGGIHDPDLDLPVCQGVLVWRCFDPEL